ncbi:MAG: hypothetical protein MUP97_03625 [Acidimicrobiia bacterium]|jgi:hypothetical protein|nr:hypothetical protein [Acidimicrobiia bacterium]
MAETKRGKKEVYVKAYVLPNGTKVGAHYRSTPYNSTGAAPKKSTRSSSGRRR